MMAVQVQVSPVITERRNSMIAEPCASPTARVPTAPIREASYGVAYEKSYTGQSVSVR